MILALLIALSPAPSQAAPWGWSTVSVPSAASLLEKVGIWWNHVLNGPERPARRQTSAPKIGCGIDPNGQSTCEPGPGTSSSEPTDPDRG